MAVLNRLTGAVAIKYVTLRRWREANSDRSARLGDWQTIRGEDGRLHVSAQVRGRDAAEALQAFMRPQALFLSLRAVPGQDDQLPHLDLSVPGRTAAVWRLSGVWVEVWYPDPPDAAPRPVQARPQATSVPSRRGLGARLPHTRRNKTLKETTTR